MRISTAVEVGDYGSNKPKELVPKRYAEDAPVVVEVKSKSNTIDIALATNP